MADEILWPLRAVSKDPTNVTKLDADRNILTSTTDLDARYVNVTGDTMTGLLAIRPAFGAAPAGGFSLIGEDMAATAVVSRFSTAAAGPRLQLNKARGTFAAPSPIVAGDNCGAILFSAARADGAFGAAGSIAVVASSTPATGEASIKSRMNFNVGDGAGQSVVFTADTTGVTATNVTATNVTATNTVTATNVTATGVTKAVALEVSSAATFRGPLIHDVTNGIGHSMTLTPPSADEQATGLVVNIQPEVSLVSCGLRVSNQGFGTTGNLGVEISDLPAGPDNYAILNNSPAASYFRGNVGISYVDPTHTLEVGGDTMLRGPLEVTGNITSAGTAHSFANGSIGSPAVIGNTPRTIAATGSAGSAGQMVWDDNFIYLRTAGGWKKVALTAI
jgi:hypothetical protein